MEHPKDYYEERFHKRDIDDAKINGFLVGCGVMAAVFVAIFTGVKFIPLG